MRFSVLAIVCVVPVVGCSGTSLNGLGAIPADAGTSVADASGSVAVDAGHADGAPDASPDASLPPGPGPSSVDAGTADTGSGGSSSGSSSGGSSSGSSSGGPPADLCEIGGMTYHDQDLNPTNICQWCIPEESTTSWSNITDGAACGDETQACFNGMCTSNFPDCVINGVDYPPNAADPADACQLCQPRQSETSWTSAPDGTPCSGGTCFGGTCG
jgi:hypothetical protein